MTRQTKRIPLMAPSPGTSRDLVMHRFGAPGARPKAYIQGSLHADELPGGLVAHHLGGLLDNADVTGEIVLVPAANPIGLDQRVMGHHLGRHFGGTGDNFNRGYPDLTDAVAEQVEDRLGSDQAANADLVRAAMAAAAAELKPTTELDTLRFTLMRLAADADIVLDLHCDQEAELYIYLGEDLWPEARDLSADLGAVATLLALDSGGGSFDEAFSLPWWNLKQRHTDKPIPAGCLSTTVELRGSADVYDDLAAQDAAGLFRFLQRRCLVAGDPGPLPALIAEATPLTGCDMIRAPVGGIVAYRRQLGETVAAGDVIAEIVDQTAPPDRARTPVAARTAGRLFSRSDQRWARAGQPIAKVAGTEPLPDRGDYLLSD